MLYDEKCKTLNSKVGFMHISSSDKRKSKTLFSQSINTDPKTLEMSFFELGQVSSNFAAAKNGQVSSKFAAANNGQVSSKFAAVKMINFLLQIFQVNSKNEKLFVADFSDFYLAVSASVNDANYRRPNSFITPMTRDMDRNMLPAVKTENFFSPIFLIFIWL